MPHDRPPGRLDALDRSLSRRRFLLLALGATTGALLAACADDDDDGSDAREATPDTTPTLVQQADQTQLTDSASPEATRRATPEGLGGTPTTDDDEVQRFLVLSRALTGFDDLSDAELARVYLDHLGTHADRLGDLYDAAGVEVGGAVTIEQLDAAGIFDDDELRALADTITASWYSGTYQDGDDTHVATYITALAWPASGYRLTGPSTCSGAFGNWTQPPAA